MEMAEELLELTGCTTRWDEDMRLEFNSLLLHFTRAYEFRGGQKLPITVGDALAHAGIDALKKFFFETMGIPAKLRAVGITDDRNFEVMAKKACEGSKGSFVPLSKDDIVEIYRAAF